jgi:ferrous iron transport protein B
VGFGDWRMVTALVAGFMAKESVVSTLTVLFGTTEALLVALDPAAAFALLVFCLLYTPCVAAVSSIKRELGGKWAVGIVVGQCIIAWIFALITYGIGSLIMLI